MAQRKVLLIDAGHQAFDELDAADIPGGAGSPTDADYLVGTANAGLSAEIVVGTTPGGELGGTWASPTVDATHSGSTHAATQSAAEATAASALSTHEADTTSIHGIANTANVYVAGGTDVAVGDGGTGASTAAGARTNLGLVIGTDVRAEGDKVYGGASGGLAASYARWNTAVNQTGILVSARLNMWLIELGKGMVISTVTFVSATTALSVGVNQWFALFDVSRNKLRVTNDDTSTAWAANTAKTLTLATTYTVLTSGYYYVGIMVKATTVPTLAGLSAPGVIGGIAPVFSGDADTGLTDPASCPATAAALNNTTTTKTPYFFVS